VPGTYDFGVFHLDATEHLLLREGRPVPLPPKAFDLLVTLVEHAGHLREKKELMDALWPGTFVEEVNLAYTVSALRKALGDTREKPEFIETVPTKGYRFVCAVRSPAGTGSGTRGQAALTWRRAAYAAALLALASTGVIAARWYPARVPTPSVRAGPVRLAIPLPSSSPVFLEPGASDWLPASRVAVSPDGRRIAYVGRNGGGAMLFVRESGGEEFRILAGTEGASHAFFSPDGASLGFLTDHQVEKVALDGTMPEVLCEARSPVRGAWRGTDIYFSVDEGRRLLKVPAHGGSPVTLAAPREPGWFYSDVLPGGDWALATALIGRGASGIAAVSTRSGEVRPVLPSGYGVRYVDPGRLVFARASSLCTVPFDPASLKVGGAVTPIAEDADVDSSWGLAQVGASADVLVYVPGSDRARGTLTWVDRAGHVTDTGMEPGRFGAFELDRQGRRVAVNVQDVMPHVWIYDFDRREGRRLPTPGPAGYAVWSPDGREVAYAAFRSHAVTTTAHLRVQAMDGESRPRDGPDIVGLPEDWSPDGQTLVLRELRFFRRGGAAATAMSAPPAFRWSVRFSPSGRWVAYTSNESGQYDIWLRSFPDGGITQQVSAARGGMEIVWLASGDLYYRLGNRFYVTTVRESPALSWTPPELAFETNIVDTHGRSFAVSPDGRRLLVVRPIDRPPASSLHVVWHWRALNGARP
jgi:DNA-binding winged helix-turn-helix (wHTH) protein